MHFNKIYNESETVALNYFDPKLNLLLQIVILFFKLFHYSTDLILFSRCARENVKLNSGRSGGLGGKHTVEGMDVWGGGEGRGDYPNIAQKSICCEYHII